MRSVWCSLNHRVTICREPLIITLLPLRSSIKMYGSDGGSESRFDFFHFSSLTRTIYHKQHIEINNSRIKTRDITAIVLLVSMFML